MLARATSVVKKKSIYGGNCFKINFFTGYRVLRTWLSPQMRNFKRWQPVLKALKNKSRVLLCGLEIKKGSLIDADSAFKIVTKR